MRGGTSHGGQLMPTDHCQWSYECEDRVLSSPLSYVTGAVMAREASNRARSSLVSAFQRAAPDRTAAMATPLRRRLDEVREKVRAWIWLKTFFERLCPETDTASGPDSARRTRGRCRHRWKRRVRS